MGGGCLCSTVEVERCCRLANPNLSIASSGPCCEGQQDVERTEEKHTEDLGVSV